MLQIDGINWHFIHMNIKSLNFNMWQSQLRDHDCTSGFYCIIVFVSIKFHFLSTLTSEMISWYVFFRSILMSFSSTPTLFSRVLLSKDIFLIWFPWSSTLSSRMARSSWAANNCVFRLRISFSKAVFSFFEERTENKRFFMWDGSISNENLWRKLAKTVTVIILMIFQCCYHIGHIHHGHNFHTGGLSLIIKSVKI